MFSLLHTVVEVVFGSVILCGLFGFTEAGDK